MQQENRENTNFPVQMKKFSLYDLILIQLIFIIVRTLFKVNFQVSIVFFYITCS